MSNNCDPDYISSQLALQDDNNRSLNLARAILTESAAISLVIAAINWLVDKSKMDRPTAKLIKSGVSIIGHLAKAWFAL
ncbi:hypothetical protein [Planktothrix mougeotii]|nr:hypothetical protein [Planktothrix mougeotii]